MRQPYLKAIMFALAVVAAPALSSAADSPTGRAPAVTVAPAAGVAVAPAVSETIVITEPSPIMPAPVVRHGCSRIWRCDAVICEWRRGCYGIYGYMEGPYYTLPLAKRQYERHGWPTEQRTNFSYSK